MDSLRRIVQVLRVSSRQAEQKVGLTGAQLFVLSQLRGTNEMSINDLAEKTATHQSTVSVVVERLVKQRLVRRTTSRSDGRKKVLALTSRGEAVLSSAPDAAQEKLIAALRHMKGSDRARLAALLHEWAKQIVEDDAPVVMFEEREARKRG